MSAICLAWLRLLVSRASSQRTPLITARRESTRASYQIDKQPTPLGARDRHTATLSQKNNIANARQISRELRHTPRADATPQYSGTTIAFTHNSTARLRTERSNHPPAQRGLPKAPAPPVPMRSGARLIDTLMHAPLNRRYGNY